MAVELARADGASVHAICVPDLLPAVRASYHRARLPIMTAERARREMAVGKTREPAEEGI